MKLAIVVQRPLQIRVHAVLVVVHPVADIGAIHGQLYIPAELDPLLKDVVDGVIRLRTEVKLHPLNVIGLE